MQALRAQIRAIKKAKLAQEVYEQKLAEAQEVARITIEAGQKMGELLKGIEKQSGGDRRSEDFKNSHRDNFEKSKAEKTADMGMSPKQVSQYQQMADNPEAVQAAIQKAIENGDVVSRSQVMKEINALKAELKAEQERREQAESQVKEVYPSDYRAVKSKARAYDEETARLNRKLEEAYRKRNELEDRIRDMEQATAEGLDKSNLSENVFYFCAMCNNFIGNVGGLVWLTERINDMPAREKEMFLKAASSFRDWASAFTANLERSIHEHTDSGINTAVSLLSDHGECGKD